MLHNPLRINANAIVEELVRDILFGILNFRSRVLRKTEIDVHVIIVPGDRNETTHKRSNVDVRGGGDFDLVLSQLVKVVERAPRTIICNDVCYAL